MKNLAKLLFASALLLSACQKQEVDFSGTWMDTSEGSPFEITLDYDQPDTLMGTHCTHTENFAKVDCVLPEEGPSIQGKVDGDRVKFTVHTAYWGIERQGELRMEGDELYWTMEDGEDAEFVFLPLETTLIRK